MTVSEPGTGTTTSGHASPNGRNPLASIRRRRSGEREILTSWRERDPHILEDGQRLIGRRDDGEKEERKEKEISYLIYPMVSWRDYDFTIGPFEI